MVLYNLVINFCDVFTFNEFCEWKNQYNFSDQDYVRLKWRTEDKYSLVYLSKTTLISSIELKSINKY